MTYDPEIYYFDQNAATRFERFAGMLHHGLGPMRGKPFELQDWQRAFWRDVFGWKKKSDGNRKHRFIYLEVPKGNGKTAQLSAVSLYMASVDEFNSGRAECYDVAGDREQARIMHDGSKAILEESPAIAPYFQVYRNSIIHKKTKSTIKVLSADAHTKHGFRPFLIAFDELHVQPNRDLYDTLTKGMIKMPSSMCVMITTAGIKNTFAETIHDYAHKVANGIVEDPAWYCKIYAAGADADPFDEAVWAQTNPGYGSIILPDDFQIVVNEARNTPSALNSFLRLHLNIWTGSTHSWVPVHVFDTCNKGLEDDEELKTLPCWGGLDVAHTSDLTSFSLIFQKPDDSLVWRCWFWCPDVTIHERTMLENVNYEAWVRSGYVIATPGNVQDHAQIRAEIVKMCRTYAVQSIGFDPAYAKVMVSEIYGETNIQVNSIPPTVMSLAAGTKEMERRLLGATLNHEGNPVLRWQIDNVEVYRDTNDNIRPHKGKSRGRIDGVMSGIYAMDQYLAGKISHVGPSKYETENIVVV